ncbi:MAG: hypothetical protein ACKV2Q_31605 [Planctomycetaceae bacterium]
MIGKQSRFVFAMGALTWLVSASPVSAQWAPFGGLFRPYSCGPACQPVTWAPANGCGNGACGIQPTAAYGGSCACAPQMVAQPVTETVLRQVPVTEFRQVRQTVRKPVMQTSYVDQPVTEYRQVVDQKTVNVPTCSYQDVTEYQTVQRNCGQWVTKWHCNQKVDPCAYDNRPGFVAEMNRIGFAARQALTPSQFATREYVNQTVAQQVPVTRRVAIQGTKQVTYNVARTVAMQSTRKVAVNTMGFIDEDVLVMQPVTVVKSIPTTQTTYRFVPAGSAVAFGPVPASTALGPTPDPVSAAKLPTRPQSATRDDRNRSSDSQSGEVPAKKSSFERRSSNDEYDDSPQATREPAAKPTVRFVAAKMPDSARVTGWHPARTASAEKATPRPAATITVAENAR